MSQSSIEWFFKWVNDNYEATNLEFQSAFQQAKEMHKKEIMDAWYNGFEENRPYVDHSEDYYNEKFNNNE